MANSELYEELEGVIFDRDLEAIEKLMKSGADLNEAYDDEDEPYTLLSLAEDGDDLSFADGLVRLGASPDKTADFRIQVDGDDALCVCLHMGYMISAQALIERNLVVDHEYHGSTALHHACGQIDHHGPRVVEIVRKLLEKGADPNRKDGENRTAIGIAEGAVELYDTDEAREVVDLLRR